MTCLRVLPTLVAPALAVLVVLSSERARADVVTDWNLIAINATAVPPNSILQSRVLAIVHVAMHDAARVIDQRGPALAVDIRSIHKEYELALAKADRALELNPNDADGHAGRGIILVWTGRIDDAIAAFDTAAQFDPSHSRPRSLAHIGIAYFLAADTTTRCAPWN